MPRRIQRKRTKGWRMPPNTVYVGRGSKYGNPITIESAGSAEEAVRLFKLFLQMPASRLAGWAKDPLRGLHLCAFRNKLKKSIADLRGKNLACWCATDRPCHADVLLKEANRKRTKKK